MPILLSLALIVFLQLLCVGATFSTMAEFNLQLGGTDGMLGLLWLAFSLPRGVLSPFWGGISDRIGRKPIMIAGCLATIAGSLCWSVSSVWWMLLVSRLLDSVFSAQAPVAMAIVADSTRPEKRAAGMGMVGAAVGLAFAIGPLIGISSAHIGLHNLGYVMAILQTLSLCVILFALPETRPASGAAAGPLIPVLHKETRVRAFSHAAVAPLLLTMLLMTVASSHFFTLFPLATRDWYGWGVKQEGIGFAVLGVVGVLTQGGLVRPLVARLGELRLLRIAIPILGFGFLLMAYHPSALWIHVATATIALGGGLAVPSLQGWLSRSAGERDQGLVLGLSQTCQAAGRGFGPWIGARLYGFGPSVPFIFAAVLAMAAASVLSPLFLPKRASGGEAASCRKADGE